MTNRPSRSDHHNQSSDGFDAPSFDPRPSTSLSYQGKKRRILWAVAAVAMLFGMILPFTSESPDLARPLRIVLGLLAHLMIVQWCKYDSRQRYGELNVGIGATLIIPAIGFAVYALTTRGLAGVLLVLRGLFFVILVSLVVGMTSAAVHIFFLGTDMGQ